MTVYMIGAATVCGRISPATMGSAADRRFLETMRARTDGSLMGAGTLRAADPEMRISGGLLPPARLRCLLSGSGDIPIAGKKLFTHAPAPVIFTAEDFVEGLQQKLGSKGRVIALPKCGEMLSVRAAIRAMEGLGARSILIEGGGTLHYQALRENVVDELLLTLTPKISGDVRATSLVSGPGSLGHPFLDLILLHCEVKENEVFLHYKIEKEHHHDDA